MRMEVRRVVKRISVGVIVEVCDGRRAEGEVLVGGGGM